VTEPDLLQRALALHQQGKLSDAEPLYRQAVAADPDDVDALHLLGLLLHQSNRNEEAEQLLSRAIAIDPEVPELHNVLGLAQAAQKRPDAALDSFRRALEIDPVFPDALQNISGLLQSQGRVDQAIELLEKAVATAPDSAAVHFVLGRFLHAQNRLQEAIEHLSRAVTIDPRHADAQMNLGLACIAIRDFHSAGQAFLNLTRLRPGDPHAYYHLGIAYDRLSDGESAIRCYLRAIELKPDYVEAHNNLGVIYHYRRRMGDAITHHKAAIAARPHHATAQANLGWDYWALGLVKEAITYYRKALEYDPTDYLTHSNLLMALHYLEENSPQQIFDEHLQWADRHARRLYPPTGPSLRTQGSALSTRLRIGYVSSNFREHAVSIFFEPIMKHHDREQFEIFCYSDVPVHDAVTARIQSHADHWHDTQRLTDEQLDALIRSHQLDILVDLNGHIADNRLMVFARKPAPIQVTYLGYPDTTGLATMDYRLTDAWQDPPASDAFATEKLIRLPDTAWTYDPWSEIPLTDPPSLKSNFITFGSLNNLAKISPPMIELWAQILHAVPNAQLALLIQTDRFAETYFTETFAKLGIPRERLQFHTHRPHLEYLQLFSTLDIALDTYPYNGHTTTLNASWMGVPVVTLAGVTHVARAGLGVLSTIGVVELVTHTKDQYKQLAIALANDRDRLVNYRRSLRNQMKSSPLFDSARFTRNLEHEYRQMWTRRHAT
jgi:predicted O-linked N-acetylglucosamine transferase (SPINDLY family)